MEKSSAFERVGTLAMSAIGLNEAAARLKEHIHGMDASDLASVFEELFPQEPLPSDRAEDYDWLLGRISLRFEEGLEAEEVVDLWNVTFPADHDVFFDDAENLLYFTESSSL